MLAQLSIKNFGLIDTLALEFSANLNVLTGETGAGKSILIDALRFALGERLSGSPLREAATSCAVEAVFDLSQSPLKKDPLFQEWLTEDEPTLIFQRSLDRDGRQKGKINGSAVTIQQLREAGASLVDFHGPHDHQLLLSEDSHQKILDRLGSFQNTQDRYTTLYQQYLALKNKKTEILGLVQSRDRELDLLKHQIQELQTVPLEEKDYQALLDERTRLLNTERLNAHLAALMAALEEDDPSLSDSIRKLFAPLRALQQIDATMADSMALLTQIQEGIEQLTHQLKEYHDRLAFEPGKAEIIHHHYDLYETIRRKYGPSLKQAADFFEEAQSRFVLLSNLTESHAALDQQMEETRKALLKEAQELSRQRKKIAQTLKTTIEKELSELGIPGVRFEVSLAETDFHPYGKDKIIFHLSPNPGEPLKPLAHIVSSGEAARVMLALKKALTKVDPIPTLIFDEIDAQIGGRLGTVTGKKLKGISLDRQIILITHLPQIASFADNHFKIFKTTRDNRTTTSAQLLTSKEKIKELAEMMSGKKETDISLSHARTLLKQAQDS